MKKIDDPYYLKHYNDTLLRVSKSMNIALLLWAMTCLLYGIGIFNLFYTGSIVGIIVSCISLIIMRHFTAKRRYVQYLHTMNIKG